MKTLGWNLPKARGGLNLDLSVQHPARRYSQGSSRPAKDASARTPRYPIGECSLCWLYLANCYAGKLYQ